MSVFCMVLLDVYTRMFNNLSFMTFQNSLTKWIHLSIFLPESALQSIEVSSLLGHPRGIPKYSSCHLLLILQTIY